MLVVEMSLNNNIITNPKQNWWWLTVSSKSVAANISIQYTFIHIYNKSGKTVSKELNKNSEH